MAARASICSQGTRADKPALRRVQAPSEVSGAYFEVLTNSRLVDAVADLIGPDVRHHHNKINSKQPGSSTEVRWHQDFCFTPHSNSDLVTALLFVDAVTEQNGPLEVQAGSHRGPLHGLWHGGVFTGAVDQAVEDRQGRCRGADGPGRIGMPDAHPLAARLDAEQLRPAAHTVHRRVRGADSVRCTPDPVPNAHDGLIVRGVEPGTIRSESWAIEVPEYPKAVSFFAQQAADERAAT